MKKKRLVLIAIILAILAILLFRNYQGKIGTATGSAMLSWSANSESDLAGYRIYYGDSQRTGDCPPGGYPEKVEVGNATSYLLENLEAGKTYYFSVTSYNASGKESCFSAEMKKTIDDPIFSGFKKIFRQ